MRTLLIVFVGLTLIIPSGRADDLPPPRPVSIEKLIERLGSESFAGREEVSKQLALLKLDRVPACLTAAARSADPEVRQRANAAISLITDRRAERLVARGRRFAQNGDISLFVAASREWDLPPGNHHIWTPVFESAGELVRRSWDGVVPVGVKDLRDRATYFAKFGPEVVRTTGQYTPVEKMYKGRAGRWYPQAVLAAEYDTPSAISSSVGVATRGVHVGAAVNGSVIYANSSIKIGEGVDDSIIVCDGDVDITHGIHVSIVIARGNIRGRYLNQYATLVAGGEITLLRPPPKNPSFPEIVKNTLAEKQQNPLGFVKFFELARVGAEVAVADKVVRLSGVAQDKAFAAAGAKVGDVVEGVNGTKPESAEGLRRLLRDALAVGDAAVKVKRGDATHTLRVTLPE